MRTFVGGNRTRWITNSKAIEEEIMKEGGRAEDTSETTGVYNNTLKHRINQGLRKQLKEEGRIREGGIGGIMKEEQVEELKFSCMG